MPSLCGTLWVCVIAAHLGGCSVLFHESTGTAPEDAGVGLDATGDGAAEDTTWRAEFSIGPNGDFPSISAWLTGRRGNLATRAVYDIMEISGDMDVQAPLAGPGCDARWIPTRENTDGAAQIPIYLDNVQGDCSEGTVLGSADGMLTIRLGEKLASGVIERGILEPGVVFLESAEITNDAAPPWTTTAQNYIEFAGPPHQGSAGAGATINPPDTTDGIVVGVPHTHIEDIEITGFGTGNHNGVLIVADDTHLSRMLIHDQVGSPDGADGVVIEAAVNVHVDNSMFYNIGRAAIAISGADADLEVSHASMFNCMSNLNAPSSYACLTIDNETGHIQVRNSIIVVGNAGGGTPHFALNAKDSTAGAFSGSANLLVRTGDTSPAEFLISGSLFATEEKVFVSPTGAVDLHLLQVSTANDAAIVIDDPDLFSDIDGDIRSPQGPWDLGADEIN